MCQECNTSVCRLDELSPKYWKFQARKLYFNQSFIYSPLDALVIYLKKQY